MTIGHSVVFQSKPAEVSRREKALGLKLLSLGLLLRVFFIFRYRFDSDEPQHLHVVWAWAHGLLQYRDVFDNHAPLFHMLCSPLVEWFGERADLLLLMRLTMLPVWGVTLWGTYRVASALSCRRLGWWATILTGLFPPFFMGSIEFRTDDLWAMLWILAVALLVSGRTRPMRSLVVGAVLGAAFGVSMKSILLLASLALGGLMTTTLRSAEWCRPGWAGRFAANLGAAVLGGLFVPTAIVIWFYSKGAFVPFYYGVIQHNLLPGMGLVYISRLSFGFIPTLVFAWLFTRAQIVRRSSPGPQTTRRSLVFLTLAIYVAAVETLWPIVTRQDFLPAWPMLVVSAVPFLDRPMPLWLAAVFSRRRALRPAPAPMLLLVAALCGAIWLTAKVPMPWRSRTAQSLETWKAVLSLTNPSDYVMDLKGELLFRRRAVYYVFEHFTKARIKQRLIEPQIARRLVETRTCIVSPDIKGLPQDALQFIEANYLLIGPLRVVGKILTPQASDPALPISFEVAIPAQYQMVTPLGPAGGELDGTPYRGIRFLGPGRHEFRPSPGENRLALVWARAVDNGFSPFTVEGKSQ